MVSSAIFQAEVTSLDAQLAELQAQIATVQEQRATITKAEAVAAGIVQAVTSGVEEFQQIAGISADAIARVRDAVLGIFQGGDNGNNGNDGSGNYPLEPAPQPSDDGGAELAIAVEAQPEALTGQSCEWASPLCCLLEDAPQSVLAGQAVDLAQIAFSRHGFKYLDDDAIAVTPEVSPEVPQPEPQSEPEQLASDFQKEVQARGIQTIYSSDGTPKFDLIWTRLSDRVATYSSPENPYNWEGGFVTYLGFATKEVAEAWQQHLLKIGAATKCIIRKVNRLKVDTPKGVRIRWEMKCHGLSESQLQNILASDLTQVPVCYLPEPEVLAALAKFHSGDRVKVVKPWANGDTRDMNKLGTVNRLVVRDGLVAVNLDDSTVERQYTPDTIEPLTIQDLESVAPMGVIESEPIVADASTTDWEASAKELGISLDNIAPGHYLAYHKYRKLGEVIEKHDAINSYYVNRNQRTMLVVGSGDGQQYSNLYECAIGLAKFLKVIVEPEVAKADLNGSYSEPFPAPQQTTEQPIEANDWVELLVTGDRYQVAEVDNEGIHLATDDGNMLAQPDEVKLLMKIPATWQPF